MATSRSIEDRMTDLCPECGASRESYSRASSSPTWTIRWTCGRVEVWGTFGEAEARMFNRPVCPASQAFLADIGRVVKWNLATVVMFEERWSPI